MQSHCFPALLPIATCLRLITPRASNLAPGRIFSPATPHRIKSYTPACTWIQLLPPYARPSPDSREAPTSSSHRPHALFPDIHLNSSASHSSAKSKASASLAPHLQSRASRCEPLIL